MSGREVVHHPAMPSILRSISTNAAHMFIASFLLVPVIVTAILLPSKSDRTQDEDTTRSEKPLASKIAEQGKVNEQRGSPLFSVLPPEIRNRIFAFACTAYEIIPYTPNDWFYRPGYHGHRRISAALLATCKRIYVETYTLPLELNEHVFWGSIERGPPQRYSGVDNYKRTDLNAFFDCLTPHQRATVQEVHLFTQQFWLEDLDLSSGRIEAKKIKLTLRHQDWYFWENEEPLGICPWLPGRVEADDMEREKDMIPSLPRDLDRYVGWGRQFEFVNGLEELEIEFETLRVLKEVEMDSIVSFAKQWKFPLMRDGFLEWDEASGLKESTWTGSKLLRGELDEPIFDFYEDIPDNMSEANHEPRLDSPAYETGSTYEYSDWEEEPPSFAEQEEALAEIIWHANLPAASPLHTSCSDMEHPLEQQEAAREDRAQTDLPEAAADDRDMTGTVIYEPPQIIDAVDTHEIDEQSPARAEAPADGRQDHEPALPLLALESNVQDYHVVSMMWRKRR